MNALLIGPGAVGLGIAASLLDSGWKLDILAAGKTKESLDTFGIIRRGLFKEITVPAAEVKTFSTLDEIQNQYDFVLVCTKTTASLDVAAELSQNKHKLKRQGKIVLFQNGFGNDEVFLETFSKDRIYSARIITGFSRPERYISEVTVHAAPILIGSLYGEDLECMIPLVEAINSGGLPCAITEEIEKALWAKMLYNCTLNPLSAVLNANYGELAEDRHTIEIMDGLIEEIFQVMRISGYSSYWDDPEAYKKEFYEQLIPPTCDHRSSTLQDIEKKIKTEIDSLTGVIVKLGNQHHIPVPLNQMLFHLIKAKENAAVR
ncbi:2-dehydropantoate 2-reductase [Syntrophobotulus glycolicus DSM 8271]|uniref:2-dehydropantoate 2-reductase n=1 Tax=Syntrophobotulus glycolicus (strain DSM 8271 / FlGlyR) TaxID=645991 RepID=F0SY97_SYNGF|nr:2-dehydropantoate 2-reductase [Syntrophobotulus glycolicus]ADY55932.1 2-dehydropantoate 2-reductase [Syntrophobotulus glycolicus DSM 8271]